MQAAAANSATAGKEAATAKKMMAEFRAAIASQVAGLEKRMGNDAAELAKVTECDVTHPFLDVLVVAHKPLFSILKP